MSSNPELESFKRNIDLRQYAAAQGYVRDGRQSWGGSDVMRRTVTDDKIIVKVDEDGHWVYVDTRSSKGGTITDFIRNQGGFSWGALFRELRPWIGEPPVPVPSFAPLPRTAKSRFKVEAAYARMRDAIDGHPYLERERALPGALLGLDRFAGRIRIDARGNAVFPHIYQDG